MTRFFYACALALTVLGTAPLVTAASAQEETPISPEVQAVINTPQAEQAIDSGMSPPTAAPAPVEDAALPTPPEYEDMPQVELRILDKVRAESRTYILNVGRTVAYANIRIRPRACRKSSPLDDPENAAFLQIWEVKPDNISAWIFSGWMFASSPSLSGMDHPVYDVSVLDCKNPSIDSQSDSTKTTDEAAPSAAAEDDDADVFTNETLIEDSADLSAE